MRKVHERNRCTAVLRKLKARRSAQRQARHEQGPGTLYHTRPRKGKENMTREEAIAEIMKRVDEMTLEQREQFLAYLKTIPTEKE